MLCIYVGQTTLPLLQRLRKPDTTATACVEDSSFHELLCITEMFEWTPMPLQFTEDENVACFLERDWWFRLKRWAVNDSALVVPASVGAPLPPPPRNTITAFTPLPKSYRQPHKTAILLAKPPLPENYKH